MRKVDDDDDDVWRENDRIVNIIRTSTYLLVTAGAGFSADSGLPVYKDIARVKAYEKRGMTYANLCEPRWIEEDPEVFYGFWGSCLKSYRKTKPHRGYNILKRWRDEEFGGSENVFVYTSNVDCHFLNAGFSRVYEIHGNVEEWQCSKVCTRNIFRLPQNVRFDIDLTTMRSKRVDPDRILRCEHCGESTRPSILMFRDESWIKRTKRERAYVDWEESVENKVLKQDKKRLLVLEIGCGETVPHVRRESEMVVEDILRAQIGQEALLEPLKKTSSLLPEYVCCILLRRDEDGDWSFLLERRDVDAKVASGQLTCFGGKVEEDEDTYHAIVRELREELDWTPRSLSPVVDLYVEKKYVARFYVACAPSCAEAKESGRDAVWIKEKNLISNPILNPWHKSVLFAWSQGLNRVLFDEKKKVDEENKMFVVPDYVRVPNAILIRVNPLESQYEHKNRDSSHVICGIHTISVRDKGLSFLESCDKSLLSSSSS